ncbi:MAG: hypothetical protein ABI945_01670 [Nitrospirales bacterium]
MRRLMMLGVTALGLCCWITSAHADSRSDAIETGRLLAILLDSGRLTIASHQALINDPEMDHKGLTGDGFNASRLPHFRCAQVSISCNSISPAFLP